MRINQANDADKTPTVAARKFLAAIPAKTTPSTMISTTTKDG
jgi:hypothetical protein